MSNNYWQNLLNREGADWTKPAESYGAFVESVAKLFVQKDTDYDSRFMTGMVDMDANVLWAWEVAKKLDRLRSWITRGQLQVKGEGIRNSVDDLFCYTIQYQYYNQDPPDSHKYLSNSIIKHNFLADFKERRKEIFIETALGQTIDEFIDYLEAYKLVAPDEGVLKMLLKIYMGGHVRKEDCQRIIRDMLS